MHPRALLAIAGLAVLGLLTCWLATGWLSGLGAVGALVGLVVLWLFVALPRDAVPDGPPMPESAEGWDGGGGESADGGGDGGGD